MGTNLHLTGAVYGIRTIYVKLTDDFLGLTSDTCRNDLHNLERLTEFCRYFNRNLIRYFTGLPFFSEKRTRS